MDRSYLPSLDGFRGISIMMVIIGHLCVRTGYDFLQYFFNGNLGVYVFFVISGFLITTLLLKERIRTKTISLRKFYIRRFLRIFPVAYLYLVVLLIINWTLGLQIPVIPFVGAALYLTNFSFFAQNWYTEHYWSLSIEEQFYLIFPSILKKSVRFYSLLILILITTIPVLVAVCRLVPFLRESWFYEAVHFLLKFDGVLTGSFFSLLVFQGLIPWSFIRKYKLPINLVLIACTVLLHNKNILLIDHITPFFIGIIIISNIYPAEDAMFKFLNNKWLMKIGVLSYSLYIWQQLFTMTKGEPTWTKVPWYSFPINVILLLVVSYLSYNYYEKWFLKLKDRFSSFGKKTTEPIVHA